MDKSKYIKMILEKQKNSAAGFLEIKPVDFDENFIEVRPKVSCSF